MILSSCNVFKTIMNQDSKISGDFFDSPKNSFESLVEDFEGNWVTDCFSNGSADLLAELKFNNGEYHSKLSLYPLNSQCTGTLQLYLDENGYTDISGNILTIEVIERYVTLKDSTIVSFYNSSNSCGINSWSLDFQTDILGIECVYEKRDYLGKYNLEVNIINQQKLMINNNIYHKTL